MPLCGDLVGLDDCTRVPSILSGHNLAIPNFFNNALLILIVFWSVLFNPQFSHLFGSNPGIRYLRSSFVYAIIVLDGYALFLGLSDLSPLG